jgi:P27 family predicted phage terminase small subunit
LHQPEKSAPPRPTSGAPPAPKGLGKIAKKMWRELVRVLEPTGVLTHADAVVMRQYCVLYERMLNAEAKVSAEGEVLTGAHGGTYQNPWLSVWNTANRGLTKLSERLGLDPLSRGRLKVKAKPEDIGDKARFFRAREESA